MGVVAVGDLGHGTRISGSPALQAHGPRHGQVGRHGLADCLRHASTISQRPPIGPGRRRGSAGSGVCSADDPNARARLGLLVSVVILATPPLDAQNDPDRKDWIQLFNGKRSRRLDRQDRRPRARRQLRQHLPRAGRAHGRFVRPVHELRREVRAHVLSRHLLVLPHRGRVPVRRRTGEGRAGMGAAQQRHHGPRAAARDDAQGSGFPDLDRGAAARRKRQPASARPRTCARRARTSSSTARSFTTHCLNSKSKTYHGDQWVRVEAEVLGAESHHALRERGAGAEYEQAADRRRQRHQLDPAVKKDGTLLTGGSISLQSESHPVEFRKVELLTWSAAWIRRRRTTRRTS